MTAPHRKANGGILFSRKSVVHVQTRVALDAGGNPRPGVHVATYSLQGEPVPYSKEISPEAFRYVDPINSWVKGNSDIHAEDRKRLVVKVWRMGTARVPAPSERPIAYSIAILIVLLSLIVAGLVIALQSFDDKGASAVPGVLLTSTAVNGVTAAGVIFARASKLSSPFAPTGWWFSRNVLSTLAVLALNVALLYSWPQWDEWLAQVSPVVATTLQLTVASVLLVATLAGSFISSFLSVFQWSVVQELQRSSLRARRLADFLQGRTHARKA